MQLFESFNTTNQTEPVALPHFNFIEEIELSPLDHLGDLDFHEKCKFIMENPYFEEFVQYIDYMRLYYCHMKVSNILAILIFLALTVFGFLVMGVTADKFFVPALTILSNKMHLSETVAGVTILAFGNGAPDIFAALTGVNSDTTMSYSELYGAGIFNTGITAGLVLLVRPFKIPAEHHLRDVLFYVFAIVYIDYIIVSSSYVTLYESIFVVIIYILYLTVVIVDHILTTRALSNRQSKSFDAGDESANKIPSYDSQCIVQFISKMSTIPGGRFSSTTFGEDESPNSKIFEQFFNSINPIRKEDWKYSDNIERAFLILKAPSLLILLLLIPVVDYDMPLNGWSKLLNTFQVVFVPMIISVKSKMTIFGSPLSLYVGLFCMTLALIVFFTSRTDRPPKYHIIFGILASVDSIYVIWMVANEMVHVLEVIGILSSFSASFLASTVLSMGNTMGDIVTNVSLAKQGYQKMGFSACFGGPLFNTLFGLGIVFITRAAKTDDLRTHVTRGGMGETCSIFLVLNLVFGAFALSFTQFLGRKCIGIFLLCMYFLFFIYNFLGDIEVIHPYGSDHYSYYN